MASQLSWRFPFGSEFTRNPAGYEMFIAVTGETGHSHIKVHLEFFGIDGFALFSNAVRPKVPDELSRVASLP